MEWANERIHKAKAILKRNNIGENMVLPSETYYQPTYKNGAYVLQFFSADYYIYVDEGVAGIGGGNKSAITTGRFKFKTPYVGKAMAESIQDWIRRKPVPVRQSRSESKQSVVSRSINLSYAIAKNIKKTGIGKTMFWSDTFNDEAYAQLAKRLERKLGQNIRVDFRI